MRQWNFVFARSGPPYTHDTNESLPVWVETPMGVSVSYPLRENFVALMKFKYKFQQMLKAIGNFPADMENGMSLSRLVPLALSTPFADTCIDWVRLWCRLGSIVSSGLGHRNADTEFSCKLFHICEGPVPFRLWYNIWLFEDKRCSSWRWARCIYCRRCIYGRYHTISRHNHRV